MLLLLSLLTSHLTHHLLFHQPATRPTTAVASYPSINRPKRYLDTVLDPDAFEDLQPDALPPMSEHPYPSPEGYSSSPDYDLDDFAEVWSEPLNHYMVLSRRREQFLGRGLDDWDTTQMQQTATRVTTWASQRSENVIQLKRARLERRRQEEEERIRLEQVRAQEEAKRIEREEAERAKKLRKREAALASRERTREKNRLAEEAAKRYLEAERAKKHVAGLEALRVALEKTQQDRLRDGAESATHSRQDSRVTERSEEAMAHDPNQWSHPPADWAPHAQDHYNGHSKRQWSNSSSHHYSHQQTYEEEGYPPNEMMDEDPEAPDESSKARIPSNLANLLNSPNDHHAPLGPQPPSNTRDSRTHARTAVGSTGKRKRGTADSVSYSPTPSDSSAHPHFAHHVTNGGEQPGMYAHHPLHHLHSVNPMPFQAGFVTPADHSYGPGRIAAGTGSAHASPSARIGIVGSETYQQPRPSSSSSHQLIGTASHSLHQFGHPFSTDGHSISGPQSHPAGTLLNATEQPTVPLIDPVARRIERRSLPAWGHDLPYGTEPYESFSDQLDASLPVRERTLANPKVLANKRWEAIEENHRQVWLQIARKDVPRVSKIQQAASQSRLVYAKRLSALVSREGRRILCRTKAPKEVQVKAKRLMREVRPLDLVACRSTFLI